MKKYLILLIVLIFVVLALGCYKIEKIPASNEQSFSSDAAEAGNTAFNQLFKAKVTAVTAQDVEQSSRLSQISETLQATLLDGPQKGQSVEVDYSDTLSSLKIQEVKVSDVIVVGEIQNPTSYVLVDRYRLPYLGWIALLFLVLAIIFGRIRGLTSVVGLLAGIAILIWFIVPNILAGKNPEFVTLVGTAIIAVVSMFLAHGFKQRTMLAIMSTLLTLGLAEILANIFVVGAKLLGNGSEQAYFIQAGYFGAINLQGLLLGGIIIGTLGILNDITTAQSATIEEIHTADQSLSFSKLYQKASSVGREHIASLINTLVLVYVGSSLPLFLLFTVNGTQLWAVLNSSTIAEEIVRALVGSIALILAVPISTALAAYYFHNQKSAAPIKPADDYWDKAKAKLSSLR